MMVAQEERRVNSLRAFKIVESRGRRPRLSAKEEKEKRREAALALYHTLYRKGMLDANPIPSLRSTDAFYKSM
jgi:hypothetical protein